MHLSFFLTGVPEIIPFVTRLLSPGTGLSNPESVKVKFGRGGRFRAPQALPAPYTGGTALPEFPAFYVRLSL